MTDTLERKTWDYDKMDEECNSCGSKITVGDEYIECPDYVEGGVMRFCMPCCRQLAEKVKI